MARGIVYIITNPCLQGWVKIGQTEGSIEDRVSALNRPENIPLAFRAHAVYEVENPEEIEKHIHDLLDSIDASLHARETMPSGRIRVREFFRMSEEAAYKVFEAVSCLRGDRKNLKLIVPNEEQIEEERIAEQTIRSSNFRFSFSLLEIQVGSELKFLYNDECVCHTKDMNNKVMYDGGEYTLSGLARKLLVEQHGWNANTQVAGPKFFTYLGHTIYERFRNIRDSEEGDED